MGFFDFLFGKKEPDKSKSVTPTDKTIKKGSSYQEDRPVVKDNKPENTASVRAISSGAIFDMEFKSLTVVKQYYNNRQEEMILSTPVSARISRIADNGTVSVIFSDLSTLKKKGIIQGNLNLNPHFNYNKDSEGDEFASAEINNSFSAMNSGNEYISLFQITKQKGKIISFLINNLPGDQDFYYLLILRQDPIEQKKSGKESDNLSELDRLAVEANSLASRGAKREAQLKALNIFNAISASPNKIKDVAKYEDVALAMGRLMEGEFFTENEEVIRAVGLSYYFLSKAIKDGGTNPFLFVYRFSTTWEYNKAFYRLFAHSEGEELSMSPFDIMGQSALMAYDHHLQGMQMADGLQEPRLISLDPALGNIFRQTYSKYSATPRQQIINLGNKYHNQIFEYLETKIKNSDLVF